MPLQAFGSFLKVKNNPSGIIARILALSAYPQFFRECVVSVSMHGGSEAS